MRSWIWFSTIAALLLSGLGLVLPVQAAGLTGRAIIEEQQKRHTADNEFSRVAVTLKDRRGKEKHQEMIIRMTRHQGKSKSLIQYLAPANIRGVGLLTWEQEAGREDDQWLYMSASRKLKRIAGGSKKNQFMGTDMAFEDMRPEDLDTHQYTLVGEEDLDGTRCWKIESTPATPEEKKQTGYGRRVMWVDPATYFTRKVVYYDHHGRHIKTALFEAIKPLTSTLYRAFKITWKRTRQKTATIMVYEKIDITTPLPGEMFTQAYMRRPVRTP